MCEVHMQTKVVWGKEGADYPFFDKVKITLVLQAIKKIIKIAIPPPPHVTNKVLLDVGCGYEARVIQQLEKYFKTCIGLDFEVTSALKQHPKFLFIEGDINTTFLSLESDSVDFIVCLSILEHLDEPVTLLTHAKRILKKNGFIFFNCPNWFGKWVTEHIIKNKFIDPYGEAIRQADTHKMYYNPRDMWPLLVKAGFIPSNIKIWRSNLLCSISGYAKKM